ncbi:hypothetical protein DUNSADRAFT_12557 [Dunaliella salina]|uniref:Uncharacterized protein n=1 Tax=Dunaliella salina TaxID=3046 RepID=A0ABQ7GB22_DUNSA|nr:hypothetical protein DUNSADRAFT_12557 [Dunaliella salina]|eukprot:KAF5831810.1 hypothetical protein DUNSADRAFT_12557 [Dunaliella salina]
MLEEEPNTSVKGICSDLLVAEPRSLHHSPAEVRELVRLLYHYTKVQRMYSSSPLLLPHADLLDLHMQYSPELLAERLHKLDAEVSESLNASVQGADLLVSNASVQGADLLVAVAPCIVPLLEAPPGALKKKAAAVAALCPEFLPSSVFRAIPELLVNWDRDITEDSVTRAGDVVILGQGVRASLILSGQEVPGALSTSSNSSSNSDSESIGGVKRGDRYNSGLSGTGGNHAATSLAQLSLPGSQVAIYAAEGRNSGAKKEEQAGRQQQQQQHQQLQQLQHNGQELMTVMPNSRCLVYVSEEDGSCALSERYADPYRDEEALMSIGAGKPGAWSTPGSAIPGGFFRKSMWLMWPSATRHP